MTRADAWLRGALLLAVLAAAGLALYGMAFSPASRVILHDAAAPWIMASEPFTAQRRQAPATGPPRTRFTRDFELPQAEAASIRLRAFGEAQLFVNGEPVTLTPDPEPQPSWRSWQRAELPQALPAGRSTLQVDVRNPRGPALLSLRLEAGAFALASGTDWHVSLATRPFEPALLADDRRRHPDSEALPRPRPAFAEHAGLLGLLFALFAGGFALAHRSRLARLTPGRIEWLTRAVLACVWGLFFCISVLPLAPTIGFDARHHLAYIELLASEWRLPLAHEGWATYHPPLYYAVSAALLGFGRLFSEAAGLALMRLPAFLAGFGTALLSARLASRLLPGDPRSQALGRSAALLFAGLLPMNLALSAYVSNESFHALLCATALVCAVEILLEPAPTQKRLALFSLVLGLAMLAKYTAFVLAACALPLLALHVFTARRADARARGLGLAALTVPALLVCGAFYARNGLFYGHMLVPNWEPLAGAKPWWLAPGFHTPAYYAGFGAVLHQPWFAGFAGFWDGLYSTLWGDGLLAGSASLAGRNPRWDYGWMAADYLLALPATIALAAGFASQLRRLWREPQAQASRARALALGFAAALVFAIFYATLSLPYYGQTKAFYALAGTPVLALCLAHALCSLDGWLAARGSALLRAAVFGLAGTTLAGFALAHFPALG